MLLIFWLTARAFRGVSPLRWVLASLATLALFTNQLFAFTAGRAWNHDLAVLTSLVALTALMQSYRQTRQGLWVIASGLSLGIAIGTRLTFLPLVFPFAFFIAVYRPSPGDRFTALFFFFGALALALLPTWILWARAPSQFVFDNLIYNSTLNRTYAASLGKPGVWLSRKLLFAVKLLKFPQNLSLCLAFGYLALWLPMRKRWKSILSDREIVPTVCLLPFLFIGAFAPSPSYKQYYYAIVPFLLVAVALGLARVWNTSGKRRARIVAGLLAITSFVCFAFDLPIIRHLASPQTWTAFKVHQIGQRLRTFTSANVLTLSPIFPLEGGLEIYPEFATGPFAWRAAPFARDDLKPSLKMTDAKHLEEFLASRPAAAILIGFDTNDLEQPLNTYAKRHNYRLQRLPGDLYLWIQAP